MSVVTPVSGILVPEDTDILNAEAAYANLAGSLDTLCVPRYATATARDTAMAGGATEGQLCTISSGLQRYDGVEWSYAEEKRWWNPTVDQNFTNSTAANITGFSFLLATGVTYRMDVVLTIDGTVAASAADFAAQYTFTGTLGGSGFASIFQQGPATSVTSQSGNMASYATQNNTFNFGTSSAAVCSFTTLIINVATGGTFQMQGRQLAAAAETLTLVAASSYASVKRVA